MAWDQGETPADLRAEAEKFADVVAGLEGLYGELREESVKESRLEGLYDQVTTSNPQIWNTATAFIDVEDGEASISDVSKLAEGKWAPEIVDDCDAMVTLEVQRGLMPDDFKYLVSTELDDRIEEFREEAARARQRAAKLEDEGDAGRAEDEQTD